MGLWQKASDCCIGTYYNAQTHMRDPRAPAAYRVWIGWLLRLVILLRLSTVMFS